MQRNLHEQTLTQPRPLRMNNLFNHPYIKKYPFISALAAITVVAFFFFCITLAILYISEDRSAGSEKTKDIGPKKIFATTTILATHAAVYDPQTNTIIYDKNASEPRPLASITKVMTAFTAYELASTTPYQIVPITADALSAEGDSGLTEGEQWYLKDLLAFTLVASSNDGAYAIADHFGIGGSRENFVEQMDTKARTLGLSTFHFNDPAGLDNADETVAGGVGSASDVAKLGAIIFKKYPELLEGTNEAYRNFYSASGVSHRAKNTDTGLYNIPQLLGGKTGFTDLAGGNLMVIINVGINHPVVLVVLGSTADARFTDIKELASSTMAYFGTN